jgi:recombinational DNA repair protein (RecF pathway)
VKATTTSKEFFNFYKYGVELITKKPENEYVNICAILKNYILLFGLMSEPNYCISCGNQEINNFSPYLGGMVCQTCTQKKDIPKIDPNVFQIIFGIFNDDKFLDNPTVEKNILRSVITILLQYVQKNLDTKILFK